MVFNLRDFSFSSANEDDPTPPKSFSLKELREATSNFSHGNIVGGSNFGSVYRGRLADGSSVAVKRAVTIDQERKDIFEREMQVASSVLTHPNVLTLRGYCRAKKELLLDYPLMIHNSLASNLGELPERSTRPLDWTTRKRIAMGAARGLAHLHGQGNARIMHRVICPSTVLLNAQFEAVIAGFCSAVIMRERDVREGTVEFRVGNSVTSESGSQIHHCYDDVYVDNLVHGVIGFIAPEYRYSGKCTLKNDVFAYGRTLLELISGQATSDLSLLAFQKHIVLEEQMDGRTINKELKEMMDPELQGNYVEEEAEGLVRLASLCAHDDPSIRPEMSQVVRMLEIQFLGQDPSGRSSWSRSDYDSTPYCSFPPSPSPDDAP